EELSGRIRIRRYRVSFPRSRILFGLVHRLVTPFLLRSFSFCPLWLRKILRYGQSRAEWLWLILQGPYVPSLIRDLHLNQHLYRKIYFFTWLYYPSRAGILGLEHKSVLIPTAHDEKPFWFPSVPDFFKSVSAILVNSPAEKRLIRSLPGCQQLLCRQAGVGPGEAFLQQADDFPSPEHLPEKYLCFLGRLTGGKGLHTLCEYFIRYLESSGEDELFLVLAGFRDKNLKLPVHSHILVMPPVSESEKLSLLRGCLAVVNPSHYESLSLLIMEALLLRKPAIVNGANPVLADYAKQHRSVQSFHDPDSFQDSLQFFRSAEWLDQSEHLLTLARKWVLSEYSWDKILNVFDESL
ncbi:MAG: glycosyltransferase, partial [Deltaproteobacteria bacterium]|nr:glycosyltransferase [Deltaproteobacteria bacterium]